MTGNAAARVLRWGNGFIALDCFALAFACIVETLCELAAALPGMAVFLVTFALTLPVPMRIPEPSSSKASSDTSSKPENALLFASVFSDFPVLLVALGMAAATVFAGGGGGDGPETGDDRRDGRVAGAGFAGNSPDAIAPLVIDAAATPLFDAGGLA